MGLQADPWRAPAAISIEPACRPMPYCDMVRLPVVGTCPRGGWGINDRKTIGQFFRLGDAKITALSDLRL